MLKLKRTRKTYYLEARDSVAIQQIKDRFGQSTDSDAVRFALRLVAESAVQIGKKRAK